MEILPPPFKFSRYVTYTCGRDDLLFFGIHLILGDCGRDDPQRTCPPSRSENMVTLVYTETLTQQLHYFV